MSYVDIILVQHKDEPPDKQWSVKFVPGLNLEGLESQKTSLKEAERLIDFLSTRVLIRTQEDADRELHNWSRKSQSKDGSPGRESD